MTNLSWTWTWGWKRATHNRDVVHGVALSLSHWGKYFAPGDIERPPCFCSVAQLCLSLCDPMDCSMPGFPVLHHLLEAAQTHVHRVSDATRPSHPLLFPCPPAFNLSQHQGKIYQLAGSLNQVGKVLVLGCPRRSALLSQGSREYISCLVPKPELHNSIASWFAELGSNFHLFELYALPVLQTFHLGPILHSISIIPNE